MTSVGWLPADVAELFGAQATAEESYGVLTVDVPSGAWIPALEAARDRLGCTFFDWLSAVDEPGTGFRVAAHVAALSPVRRLLLRTTVPHDAPELPSAVGVYAGAAWHERETHEMFGVGFTGHPGLDHLLLPEGFQGHPLRKDFVLAARVAKAWPGAKEPGESEHGGPKRRQMLPPGVPDPNEWGPLKGQLPPAPARPARRAATAAARTPGERPPRRTRTASEGSAGRTAAGTTGTGGGTGVGAGGAGTGAGVRAGTGAGAGAGASGAGEGAAQAPGAPRRSRSVSEGSASQRGAGAGAVSGAGAGEGGAQPSGGSRRSRSASEGSASQRGTGGAEAGAQAPGAPRRSRSASEGSAGRRADAPARRSRSASEGSASQRPAEEQAPAADDTKAGPAEGRPDPKPPIAPRSPDAPWHHARPAFEEPTQDAPAQDEPAQDAPAQDAPAGEPEPEPDSEPRPEPDTESRPGPDPAPAPEDTTPDDPSGGRQ
ncbi:NADH-quinone oxidoreductase subunit C [Streptomyces sp. NPDC052092]|uniref:NADH-quinone oxidoreductase subunit C n=1 Tax=Streptomyces sp. NPDC052092 TaxID=3365685 RepID=UPI0037D1B836